MRRNGIIAIIVIILIIIGIFVWWGGSHKSQMQMPPPSGSSTANSPVQTNQVTISGYAFSPSTITVKKGTTVAWMNNDPVAHTVTFDAAGPTSSGSLNHGDQHHVTFSQTGTFTYHCTFHASMHGQVIVTD